MEGVKQIRGKLSRVFIVALSIVSIIGFLGIISQSFFGFDVNSYIDAALMFVIGIALIIESRAERLKTLKNGIDSDNFTALITVIVGSLAVASGILSIPQINVQGPTFLALKGILSIIAIIVIIVQTWVVEKKGVEPAKP